MVMAMAMVLKIEGVLVFLWMHGAWCDVAIEGAPSINYFYKGASMASPMESESFR